ncbi:MAG: Hpt domain-containing protein [Oscillospiraceae bacterium]|nr:Hpt domain-containing protein [Oscillospiraceae bacterium]
MAGRTECNSGIADGGDDMQTMMQCVFVENNQEKYGEIAAAINAGDTKLAHRLAHSLKGNAGQIGRGKLQSIAGEVETLLKNGDVIPADVMRALEAELSLAIEELAPIYKMRQKKLEPLNAAQTRELFQRLEPMLANLNPECLDLLDEISAVHGAQELARQIGAFALKPAAETLAKLKLELGIGD